MFSAGANALLLALYGGETRAVDTTGKHFTGENNSILGIMGQPPGDCRRTRGTLMEVPAINSHLEVSDKKWEDPNEYDLKVTRTWDTCVNTGREGVVNCGKTKELELSHFDFGCRCRHRPFWPSLSHEFYIRMVHSFWNLLFQCFCMRKIYPRISVQIASTQETENINFRYQAPEGSTWVSPEVRGKFHDTLEGFQT